MSFSLPRIFKWIYDPVKKCKTNVLLLKIGFLQNSVGNLFAPVSYGLVGPVKPIAGKILSTATCIFWYGVATISRLLQIVGLFCRISSVL